MQAALLTVEERTILDRLARGFTYKQIMVELEMKHTTLYLNARIAKAKLGAESVTQAVAIAVAKHYIDPLIEVE